MVKRQKIFLSILITVLAVFGAYSSFKNGNRDYHLIISCHIVDANGNILRILPGYLCDFYKSGDYISANIEGGISYFNRKNELVWQRNETVHHKLTISDDEQRIAFLSSTYTPLPNKEQMRWDELIVLSRAGKLLAQNSTFTLLEDLKNNFNIADKELDESKWLKTERKTYEYTHTNTFFEIGKNDLENKYVWLKRGNYLVNLHGLNEIVLFLDPSLQKILHVIKLTDILGPRISTHDLKITSKGHLLIYVNRTALTPHSKDFYSRLVEYDLDIGRIHWEYTANPKLSFSSKYHGGATLIDDDLIVFSDETGDEGWVRWINRRGEKIKEWPVPFTNPETGKPSDLQDANVKDLNSFLVNHTPL